MFYEVMEKIMDSGDATAGGGSASAAAGAMAAGLVGMVARLSTGKGCGLTDARYLEIADELDGIVACLKRGAVEDTQSYLGIKAAFALPKLTDEDKAVRRQAVEKAAIKAAAVPLENGRAAVRILELCSELGGKINAAAASDMEAGVMLAKMAAINTALNIEANLPLINNAEVSAEFADAARELKDSAELGCRKG